ncbi:MAG: twitching motility protein PilT [Clostridium sp.]|nr:twitching motility protein PilT [Clostridium sp.]
MVQIIAGGKGKGKTKYLLDMANKAVKESKGSIVYLDKSSKHMYELNNRIRLINVQEYPIENGEGFVGFLCGIICQDHDLEQMYLDSFIKLSSLEGEDIEHILTMIDKLSKKYHVDFILSISRDAHEIPEAFRENIIVSL